MNQTIILEVLLQDLGTVMICCAQCGSQAVVLPVNSSVEYLTSEAGLRVIDHYRVLVMMSHQPSLRVY